MTFEQQILDALYNNCKQTTLITIALAIDTKEQFIRTVYSKDIKKENLILEKSPAVFIIGRP